MPDHVDKRTFRVPVKLVNAVDSSDLPIDGFAMIPEDRLCLLEAVARDARGLLDAAARAASDVNQMGASDKARAKLNQDLDALATIWDISANTAVAGS
jgi:hypothetical protein